VKGYGNYTYDGCNHGTHVAGTIAALNNNVGVIGVLPSAVVQLYIVRVFGDDCAWTYTAGLADAAKKCQAGGANVISMSLGSNVPSNTEKTTFDDLYAQGVLPVAAAGNDGTTRISYPAGYDSVISVAAIDSTKTRASFSQYNAKVELSAPGVGVLSTVTMGTGEIATFTVAGTSYNVMALAGDNPTYESPKGNIVNKALCNCGSGTAICDCAGQICLIQRGTNSFAEKVIFCQQGGGVGAVIYNNAAGTFTGTLGSVATTIPSVSLSQADGVSCLGQIGQLSALFVGVSNYEYYDGTSMATPHVSAVAALIWSYAPNCNALQVRTALGSSAQALPVGSPVGTRNNEYGYGLIQADAGVAALQALKC